MSKNICLIVNTLYSGGAERIVLSIAQSLYDLGCRVDVIVLEESKNSYDTSNFEFNIHMLKTIPRPLGYIYRLKAIQANALIKSLSVKFDLIVSHLLMSDIVAHYIGYPNTYHCIHNTISKSIEVNRSNVFDLPRIKRKLVYGLIAKRVYFNSDLITVSEGVKRDVLKSGFRPRSIETIYNPFNFKFIRDQACEYEVVERDYIIHVGRFDRQKRHDILIEAYWKSGVKNKLLMVGDFDTKYGTDARELVASLGLTDRVIFKGLLANPYPYIKKAKGLVLSSDFEGLPTVIIEALILGTPVASTDCPSGPSEIFSDEMRHLLSPVGDSSALAGSISRLVGPNDGSISHNYTKFSHEQIAKKYISLCK